MTEPATVFWTECTAADVPPGGEWLGAREREVLSGLRFTRRRSSWRLGRWTAKRAVASALGMQPDAVEIVAAADGAPEAFGPGGALPVTVSISHSGALAACAVVAAPAVVGCDVETVELRLPVFGADYFAEGERAWVARYEGRERALAETLVWSAKESVLKLLRDGMRRDTREVRVEAPPTLTACEWSALGVSLPGESRELHAWWRHRGDVAFTIVADRRCEIVSAYESGKGRPPGPALAVPAGSS